jgi:hypothetical protein
MRECIAGTDTSGPKIVHIKIHEAINLAENAEEYPAKNIYGTKLMTDYALFHNGEQISKAHSTRYAAEVEAYDQGAVIKWGPDFPRDASGASLADGYEVKPVEERTNDD